MKVLIVLSAVISIAVARPGSVYAPFAYTALSYGAPFVSVGIPSQYHSQDSLGQYYYGYTGGLSSKAETKSLDGVTRGAYSYVDAEGNVQTVEYTADATHGFRVSASNLPVAPVASVPEMVEAPKPVEDTTEVAKAKAEHLAAFKKAEALAALPEPIEVPTPVAFSYASPVVHRYPYQPYGYYPYNAIYHHSF